ncbi:ATP-binding protein [Amycolatopsis sp. lyj-112]|uniref:ATP-binding protein n=1 Tax=Amycolatopsis sp. lyj-112 TaxID=2789288 RepID=UPI00397B6CB3
MEQLAALAALRFDWADTPDHVWRDSPYHVDGLHVDVLAAANSSIREASSSDGPSPIGLVLQGQKGVGKTHLLGLVRKQAHQARGYFFLNDLTAGDAFWENTVEALRRGLSRLDEAGVPQLTSFLRRVCLRARVDADVTTKILNGRGVSRDDVDAFVEALRTLDREVAMECADTARALVLYASEDSNKNYVGDDFLGGFPESKAGDRRKWGIRAEPKSALSQVKNITKLLALTGPIVIAVDQLDTLVARSAVLAQRIRDGNEENLLVAQIADGLMGLREVTRRTVTVLACLPHTWALIKEKAADTVPDRFTEAVILGRVTDAEVGRALVAKRLGVAYSAMKFVPPYPTWPIASSAFEGSWEELTPREVLKRIGAHIKTCLRTGKITELTTFDDHVVRLAAPPRPVMAADRFAELDKRYEELRSTADPSSFLDQKIEDKVMPGLLSAALRGWITEVGNDNMEWVYGAESDRNELHAWLTRTLDEASDLEEHWAFRAIAASHPIAVLHRFRKARSAAGVRKGAENRHLVLIRNSTWSKGVKTQAEIKAFEKDGGKRLKLSDSDIRTFWALDKMFVEGSRELHEWLVDRRPAGRSELLSAVLPESLPQAAADHGPGGTLPPPAADGEITLGTTVDGGKPVRIELTALRKHAAIFAGSGSGKTVLLRRIVEECALQGVSAIVLDPNNDLARLGDAWPEAPAAWGPDDAQLAKRYLAETDVVVWTPGRATGRPLAFQPLPDFAGVLDDEDEFSAAVEVAVATLAPQVRLTGSTAKTNIGLAVLRQAVVHHARTGSRSLPELIEVLADLPDGVSTLNDGRKVAADLAEWLKAAMVNDPLLAGGGDPVDPGALLAPGEGKRARVSVISFVGLPSEEQRQNFVNQLQMELFAWVKRNPAGDKPLGALFVMDEAQMLAASGTLTASTRSTIVLASQARKYGLGLLFATQAPKGLHNQVVGNAMTQFFGRLNSPAQIAAANELARAKGSPVDDISRLERAQFYVAGEAFGFQQVTTPLCLTHHPASPLRIEEVLARARDEDE